MYSRSYSMYITQVLYNKSDQIVQLGHEIAICHPSLLSPITSTSRCFHSSTTQHTHSMTLLTYPIPSALRKVAQDNQRRNRSTHMLLHTHSPDIRVHFKNHSSFPCASKILRHWYLAFGDVVPRL